MPRSTKLGSSRKKIASVKKRRQQPTYLDVAEDAGRQYALDRLESSHFHDWIRETLGDVKTMQQSDPASVTPLATPADFRRIAKNMLQSLGHDIDRDLPHARVLRLSNAGVSDDVGAVGRAFHKGVRKALRGPAVDWLAEELAQIS